MYKKVMVFIMVFSLLLLCACGQADSQETAAAGSNEIQDASSMPSENENPSPTDEQQPTGNNVQTSSNEQAPTDEGEPNSSAQESLGETALEPVDTYEEHLAALTILALSMEYPDFVLEGIYSSSTVAIEQKGDSDGIYAVFESFGEKYTVHVYPIDQERSDQMTRDIYAVELGYAAFDEVDQLPDSIDMLDENVYTELLQSLSSVSVFSH